LGKYETLQPKSVWSIFGELSKIPRGSGNETEVMNMLKAWAKTRDLAVKQDMVGNLLISIPGSKGKEKAKPILIQGHVDMVCEKNSDTKHDFEKDPIKLIVDGDWVKADGTTLGADNGIGVAMGLAVAEEKNMKHPPLEVLVTVDEERGLTGAAGVQKGFFKSRTMINLDSEEDASLFIGCAGGRDSEFLISNRKSKLGKDLVGRKVTVRGLLGGHSGLDVLRNRGNAIKILTRCLLAARDEVAFKLVSIDGGSMRNAIPRESEAVVAVPEADAAKFKRLVNAHAKWIMTGELKGIDDGCVVKVGAAKITHSLGSNCTTRTLGLLMAIPNGVTAMSQTIDGLAESSTNIGVVKTDGSKVKIVCCSRSSSMAALDGLVRQHLVIGEGLGAAVNQPEGYPGWQPNPESKIVAATAKMYKKTFGRQPELKAIHAGLECGLLTEKYPDLDIVSFGPDIHGAHSPMEKVSVKSTQKIWKLFQALLADQS
jgi:dipeptidase D